MKYRRRLTLRVTLHHGPHHSQRSRRCYEYVDAACEVCLGVCLQVVREDTTFRDNPLSKLR